MLVHTGEDFARRVLDPRCERRPRHDRCRIAYVPVSNGTGPFSSGRAAKPAPVRCAVAPSRVAPVPSVRPSDGTGTCSRQPVDTEGRFVAVQRVQRAGGEVRGESASTTPLKWPVSPVDSAAGTRSGCLPPRSRWPWCTRRPHCSAACQAAVVGSDAPDPIRSTSGPNATVRRRRVHGGDTPASRAPRPRHE